MRPCELWDTTLGRKLSSVWSAPRCGGQRNAHILQHVLLVVTHMRCFCCRSGRENTDYTQSVVLCDGGLRAWPSTSARTRNVGRNDCKLRISVTNNRVETSQRNIQHNTMLHKTIRNEVMAHKGLSFPPSLPPSLLSSQNKTKTRHIHKKTGRDK